MPTPTAAANAYAALARVTSSAGGLGAGSAAPAAATGAGGFGALLKDALGSVVEAGRNSDTQAKAMAAGNANIVDVVTAVAETEVAIEALVSVRDKVIQAYEEIMRMPI
jgi:flagellar hook-basal body complex protein FliE